MIGKLEVMDKAQSCFPKSFFKSVVLKDSDKGWILGNDIHVTDDGGNSWQTLFDTNKLSPTFYHKYFL